MTRKTTRTLLGLSIAMVMVLGSIPLGFSEPVMQACNNPNHVLVERPHDQICVSEKAAERLSERMGWKIVSDNSIFVKDSIGISDNVIVGDEATQTPVIKTATNIGVKPLISELGNPLQSVFPKYNFKIPTTANVGEEFTVKYFYGFEDSKLDTKCQEDKCGDMILHVLFDGNVSVDRTDYDDKVIHSVDRYANVEFERTVLFFEDIYHNEETFKEESFTFVIQEPKNNYYSGSIKFIVEGGSDVHADYYIDPKGVIHFAKNDGITPDFNASNAEQENRGERANEIYQLVTVKQAAEDAKYATQESVTVQEPSYIPEELWESFAEFLRIYHADKNIRQWLSNEQENNLTSEFIEDFLDAYPEFEVSTQTYDPFSFILPLIQYANAQIPSFSFVFGTVKYYDIDGSQAALENTKVCAFSNIGDTWTPLFNGQTQVCATTSSTGHFSVSTPYNSNFRMQAMSENDHAVVYDDINFQNNNHLFTLPFGNKMNINSGSQNYGSHSTSSSADEAKPFKTIGHISDLNAWYKSNVSYTPKKTIIEFDNTEECPVGVGPSSKLFSISDTQRFNEIKQAFENCPNNLISPMTNKDTLGHEYGHIQFYEQYDAKNANYPNPIIESQDPLYGGVIHSPVHENPAGISFIEAWAFFMALAYSGEEEYQPAYMKGQWNFEDQTHNEVDDSRFAGKTFPAGYNEGPITSVLLDAIDTDNETGDNLSGQLKNIWDILKDNPPLTFEDFQKNWNNAGKSSLDSIYTINNVPLPTTPPVTVPPITSFEDDFENDNLDLWTLSGQDEWETDNPHVGISNNVVASSKNCDNECVMTITTPVDLSSYEDAQLTYDRFVDNADSGDEGLYVYVSTDNSSWTLLEKFTDNNNGDTNAWKSETVSLKNYVSDTTVYIRFTAQSDGGGDYVEIDNVIIDEKEDDNGGGGGGPTPDPEPPKDTTPPSAPVISTTTTLTNLASFTVSGTAETDSTVELFVGTASQGTTTATSGTWSKIITLSEDSNSITATAKDKAGNTSGSSTTLTVTLDTIAPTFQVKGNSANFDTGVVEDEAYSQGTITNISESNTQQSISGTVDNTKAGTYTVTYSVTDQAGNEGKIIETVTVTAKSNGGGGGGPTPDPTPNTKPVIALKGSSTVNIDEGTPYNESDYGYVANDTEDGDITSDVVITGTVDHNKVGTYTIKYDVKDSKGLSADTVERTVNVNAKQITEGFIFTIPDDFETVLSNGRIPVLLAESDYGSVVVTSNEWYDVWNNATSYAFPLGNTVIEWSIEEEFWHNEYDMFMYRTHTGLQTVTVTLDAEAPVLSISDITKEASATLTPVAVGTATATDNKDSASPNNNY